MDKKDIGGAILIFIGIVFIVASMIEGYVFYFAQSVQMGFGIGVLIAGVMLIFKGKPIE